VSTVVGSVERGWSARRQAPKRQTYPVRKVETSSRPVVSTGLAGAVRRGGGGTSGAAAMGDARVSRILARVRAIPPGFVRTYGDIDPTAPRLVGRVLATTTERVPWHRVVRADGSVAMGDKQLARLRREGVPVRGGRVDLARARVPG
jgi:methylated-DNA-protein-cysteine methyltransferase related protein